MQNPRIVPENAFERPESVATGGGQGSHSPREPSSRDLPLPGSDQLSSTSTHQIRHYYHPFPQYEQSQEFIDWILEAHDEFGRRWKSDLHEHVGDYTCAVYIATRESTYQRVFNEPVDPNECAFCIFCENPEFLEKELAKDISNRWMGRFPVIVDVGPVKPLPNGPQPVPLNPFIHRPLKPGASIGIANNEGSAGSICCFLRDADLPGRRFILTCGHLFEQQSVGQRILQPASKDVKNIRLHFGGLAYDCMKSLLEESQRNPIGTHVFSHFEPIGNDWDHYFDLALIELSEDVECGNQVLNPTSGSDEDLEMPLARIYAVSLTSTSSEKQVSAVSRTCGYRSGFTDFMQQEGSIKLRDPVLNVETRHEFKFPKKLCAKLPCRPGDSGGLVYLRDGGGALAMIWGGSEEHDVAYIEPLTTILEKIRERFGLNLELIP